MPEVLSGSQPGLSTQELVNRKADDLGFNTNNPRFKNACLRWINDGIQDIQLNDPLMRRTTVHDAPLTIKSGVSTYDVRDLEADGGFGWTNCFQVLLLVIPDISSRPIEPLNLQQWRQRSYIDADQGPPYGVVLLDQFRVRMIPTPAQDYSGTGDYLQDIPSLTSIGTSKVDWPRIWDACLREYVDYRGQKWLDPQNVSAWKPMYDIYLKNLSRLKSSERTTPRRPSRAVATRNLRSNRFFPSDNSVDRRWGY